MTASILIVRIDRSARSINRGSDRFRVIELRQLAHFVAVAEEQHFTRAAQRLDVAQSTISSSVRALERELGAPLFVRTTRRVELTAAGDALLPDARRTLAAADAARARVAAVTGLHTGRVTVGSGKTLHIDVANGLARFAAEHPGIDVDLYQAGSLELIEAVGDGRLDFAPLGMVDALPERARETVQLIEVHSEPMLFACSRSHRLAERKTVRLTEVAGERFADLGPDWAIRIVNDRAFSELGRPRRVAFETNDVDELLEVVGRGLGVAVLPTSACRRSRRVRFLELRGPAPTWRTGIAVPRGRPPSPAARALFEALAPGVQWPS
jgi:DNA-binding transcriptional LysR family regulator